MLMLTVKKCRLKTEGTSILVSTEEGLVPVLIEEFDVVMVDGEIALIAEENPLWKAVLVFKAGKKLWKVTKGAAAVTKYIAQYIESLG